MKKSQRDVDAGEGGSRNPPPQRTYKRTVLRDFPRGCMHIDTQIEEVEEDSMKTSDDEFVDDETYKMSLVPPSENSSEDDVESIESELRKKSRRRWLKGPSIPDLEEWFLSTLVQPLEGRTSP
jgi:hypothetical protein